MRRTNDDREREYRDRERRRSRSPRRSASPNRSQEQRRQKRPAARRDPQAIEEERRAIIQRNEERDRLAREAAAVRNQYHRGSEVVRSHYNARPNQGREQRNASPIVNLRNFNNWIKSTLIRNFTESGNHVLDLGCGKGGDLMKWDKANVSSYTGIDLAEVSIEQARGRYRNMRHARFKAQFYAFDCFGKPVAQILPPEQRRFDVVSMQFCLHYAYETEAKARQMLANVSASLPRGGKFLGTIPDSDAIIEHVSKLQPGEKEWGNDIYKVEFENQPPPGPDVVFRPPYGHKYTFYLKDAVDIVPEYVVPFEAFRALAEEYNLELLYKKGFHEVFEEYKDTFEGGALLDRMGVVRKDGSRGIEGDEREAAGFYAAFCFEKRGAK
ncbi:mRNA capping enzyme-domain-containing protein [Protomyces lactucae-debilis]|uniref:mRNA cap guanine-N(7) methyltransferase n=1 Tax=Protomyces lactucae-debilis TaxID=2754530 RepID=A0A1Y2FCS1_PROLT|nr:mRNA capping enzyme-domain-containing protein [Protomyces lactucae-debilis]ORY81417.1 mRNA capping enzyme-domain-containing protein [Protomyces lactucae-debilis]